MVLGVGQRNRSDVESVDPDACNVELVFDDSDPFAVRIACDVRPDEFGCFVVFVESLRVEDLFYDGEVALKVERAECVRRIGGDTGGSDADFVFSAAVVVPVALNGAKSQGSEPDIGSDFFEWYGCFKKESFSAFMLGEGGFGAGDFARPSVSVGYVGVAISDSGPDGDFHHDHGDAVILDFEPELEAVAFFIAFGLDDVVVSSDDSEIQVFIVLSAPQQKAGIVWAGPVEAEISVDELVHAECGVDFVFPVELPSIDAHARAVFGCALVRHGFGRRRCRYRRLCDGRAPQSA